jgi:hypothetical protein
MANYLPPEGYEFDSNSGLYYTQVIANDEAGNQVQVVTWFNADSGEYTQNTYPIQGSQVAQTVTPAGYVGKAAAFSRDGAPEVKQAGAGLGGFASNFNTGDLGAKASEFGKDIAGKAKGIFGKASEDLRNATAGISTGYEDAAVGEDAYAFYAYDKNGNPKEPGIIRKLLYAFKKFVNKCPLWLKFAPLMVLMLIDIIVAVAKPDETQDFRSSLFLGFICIPFLIVHLIDLKRKYGAKPLMVVRPIVLCIIGILMMPSVIAVSFGIMKDAWLQPGLAPVFLWYFVVAIAYVMTYFMVKGRFAKIGLPTVELWTTAILVGMGAMWIGVLAMWIIALIIFVVTFVIIGPFVLKMALSEPTYVDSKGRVYDQFGSRY